MGTWEGSSVKFSNGEARIAGLSLSAQGFDVGGDTMQCFLHRVWNPGLGGLGRLGTKQC